MDTVQQEFLTVSEITRHIKTSLEQNFQQVKIKGELSNVRPAGSGHLYFTLKDDDAVISAVMFRGKQRTLRFNPSDGLLVIASGNISVYAKRGVYQIICDTLEPAGEGNILAMLEERKRKLAAEGLFDSERKKAIPFFPSRIAAVTSPTGAAIRDILQVLRRRNAGINLVILPAPVQGREAAAAIAAQIRRANMFSLGEVIIIGRGGGSLEDLLPFSEEEVVRAVAESEIPVISAVGHEIDTALSDLAADVRAPTPSAAAELVTARREDLENRIAAAHRTLEQSAGRRIERIRLLLNQFTPEQMERNFLYILQPVLLRLDDCKEGLLRGMKESVNERRHRIQLLTQRLRDASPKGIMEKGYAIVQDRGTGALIREAGGASVGQELGIQFLRGSLTARVEEIMDEKL